MPSIQLKGKIILVGNLKAVTGIHIGGASTGLEIGGVDNVVVRNPLTNEPYIPGSSLKGKIRSLLERHFGLELNKRIQTVRIHECQNANQYDTCHVCKMFGVAGEREFGTPARLYVRDVQLSGESRIALSGKTELPFTEVKWEASIDRITSAAVPRQMERVPGGAVFGPVEMIFNIYEEADIAIFQYVIKGIELLVDDYLGGWGSRGSGKIAFEHIGIQLKPRGYYDGTDVILPLGQELTMEEFRATDYSDVIQKALQTKKE
jgi:CRISPR-associated protein Csm3